jgi:hypothetical protein
MRADKFITADAAAAPKVPATMPAAHVEKVDNQGRAR